MNKSIISRAGAALLSFVLAGVVSAKPVNGPSVTNAVSSQDEPNCTFAYAIIYGPGCWVRVDTCGNVDVLGCLDEAALLPRFEQNGSANPSNRIRVSACMAEGGRLTQLTQRAVAKVAALCDLEKNGKRGTDVY
jgi:hypothetical protein